MALASFSFSLIHILLLLQSVFDMAFVHVHGPEHCIFDAYGRLLCLLSQSENLVGFNPWFMVMCKTLFAYIQIVMKRAGDLCRKPSEKCHSSLLSMYTTCVTFFSCEGTAVCFSINKATMEQINNYTSTHTDACTHTHTKCLFITPR